MIYAILVYATAMTLANLSVAHFGPASIPYNAFVLIGLDLTLRDWLHVRLNRWQMGLLIVSSGLLTYALNRDAGQIAAASSIAFMLAAAVDWLVFTKMPGWWLVRSNTSNVAGAAVDSLVFPTIAFGGFSWAVVLPMFVAKVIGAAIWAYAIAKLLPQEVKKQSC